MSFVSTVSTACQVVDSLLFLTLPVTIAAAESFSNPILAKFYVSGRLDGQMLATEKNADVQ